VDGDGQNKFNYAKEVSYGHIIYSLIGRSLLKMFPNALEKLWDPLALFKQNNNQSDIEW